MATVITRIVASTPQRTPGGTWEAVMNILAPDSKSAARTELQKIAGVASASISSEAPGNDAFVIYGSGPQIRVYCAFGDDAISGENTNEDKLAEAPTIGDWRMSMPCLEDDLDWINKKLKTLSARVTARAVGYIVEYEKASSQKTSARLVLNMEEFLES